MYSLGDKVVLTAPFGRALIWGEITLITSYINGDPKYTITFPKRNGPIRNWDTREDKIAYTVRELAMKCSIPEDMI